MPSPADKTPPAAATPPPRDYGSISPTVPEGTYDMSAPGGEVSEIEIEIGFGRGMFLLQRAAAVPTHRVFGFEIKKKWAYLVAQRAVALQLDNAGVFGGDIREILPRLAPDGGVARAFMHFPDPWWKKRHAKRRLLSDELLTELARLLRPGGELFIQTDVEERAAGFAEALAQYPAFELAPGGGYLDANPYQAVSNRERRAEEDGLPIYRVLAHRVPAAED